MRTLRRPAPFVVRVAADGVAAGPVHAVAADGAGQAALGRWVQGQPDRVAGRREAPGVPAASGPVRVEGVSAARGPRPAPRAGIRQPLRGLARQRALPCAQGMPPPAARDRRWWC